MTMTLVQTVTVGSGGAASIDFTSIPQTGTDLVVTVSARNNQSSGTNSPLWIVLNNDTGGNYANRMLRGSGSAVASTTQNLAGSGFMNNPYQITSSQQTSNTFASSQIYIPNYTSSSTKSVSVDSVTENNATEAWQTITAGLWTGTAAITALKLYSSTYTLVEGSTASLYTITKGSGGATVS